MEKVTLTDNRLTDEQIENYVKHFDSTYFAENEKYYKGENPTISKRKAPENTGNTPDNKIPVSYARKIIKTVVGYMYKPGLIFYSSDNKKYFEGIKTVYQLNREPLKSALLGKQTSLYGTGYELHYTDENSQPRFSKVSEREIIPLYDNSIEPQLIAAIRFYNLKNTDGGETTKINVYYPDRIQNCEMTKGGGGFKTIDEIKHYYGQVPLVVYYNNEEEAGDFDNVKPLIDAYDVLFSDSLNEFDRFAWAYLILKGLVLDKDDAENVKDKRIFEMDLEGGVEFLTKDIPHEFIEFMTSLVRKEIHKQSHVPDFLDNAQTGDSLSGVAISKLLYDFEFIAATKEAYFKEGLYKRIELISTVQKIKMGKSGSIYDIDIIMNRNIPQNDKENAEIFNLYAGQGISKETLIDKFANFVEDAQEEMKKYEAEQGESVDLDNIDSQTDKNQDTEDVP